jgi:hypothetical protein
MSFVTSVWAGLLTCNTMCQGALDMPGVKDLCTPLSHQVGKITTRACPCYSLLAGIWYLRWVPWQMWWQTALWPSQQTGQGATSPSQEACCCAGPCAWPVPCLTAAPASLPLPHWARRVHQVGGVDA